MRLTPHFKREELACKCCGEMKYTLQAVTQLEALRVEYGVAMRLSSGYRCPKHNQEVSSSGSNGPHTVYMDNNIAVNVLEYGNHAFELVELAIAYGWQGIGLQQKGDYHKRFVHLDRLGSDIGRPRPWIWTY